MATPSYTTDLTDITTAETNTGWSELDGHTAGGADTTETDYFIHGNACISQSTGQQTGTTTGLEFDFGSDMSGSMTTGFCFFIWQIFLAPNAIATWVNGGMQFVVGSASGDVNFFKTMGSDFGTYPYGGWQNSAVDPTYTPDGTEGTPTGAYQIFGSNPNLVSSVTKGNPHGVDAIRYGRGELIIEHGDEANGYGTFAGIASQNDISTNRWGLFQEISGGYKSKGLISFGNATNLCDFRDANRNIVIDDTPRTYADFNKIEINNTSSIVDWTNIQISSLGTLSKGNFEVIDDSIVNFDTCVFTDMGTFVFQSNSTINNSTFRRTSLVTQGSSIIYNTIFDGSVNTIALLVNSLNDVSECTFYSDGTGHAVDLGSIISTQSLNWNNFNNDYATVDGSTGNETILVNVSSGETLTISVGSGYDTPSIYNTGTGTVNVVSGQVTLTILVKDINTGAIIPSLPRVYIVADTGGSLAEGTIIIDRELVDANAQVTDTRSYASNQPITGWVRKATNTPYYKTAPVAGTIDNVNGLSLTIQMIRD